MSDILHNQTLPVNSEKRSTVIRVVHNRENPFVQLNKQALWDDRLSLKATGLWARCMSRPNDWVFSIKELVGKCKEGRKAIDAAMQELIECGYAMRLEFDEKGSNGKFKNRIVEYVFFEFPATQEEKDQQLQTFNKFHRDCRFGNLRFGNFQKEHLLIQNNTEIRENPLQEEEDKRESIHNTPKKRAADAAGGCEEKIPKVKRLKSEFSSKVREVGTQMLNIIVKHNPVYRPPKDLTKFLSVIESMIETDKQDPDMLLQTFEWAVCDTEINGEWRGWQCIICRNKTSKKPQTNPAEIFKDNLSNIYSRMNARPVRKFAPCSDQNVAMEYMEEMNRTAL